MKRKNIIICLLLVFTGITMSHGQPDIAVPDTVYDFGHVALGDTGSWAFKIFNFGTDTLIADSATITLATFAIASPTFPETIVVNDSIEVTVWFIPTLMDTVSDTLNIFSNDPTDSVVYVLLNGTGIAPDIALSDTSHNYGHVLVGDSADWVLTIYNEGTDSLTVDSVVVNPSEFKIPSPTFPDTIPPIDSIEVTVWFFPTDTGAVTGSLLVFSSDPDEESLSVSLSGAGVLQDIVVSDTTNDYGNVLLGDSLDWVLTIYNEGTANLTLDSILSTQLEFEVTAPPLPDTLSSADSVLVTITFIPSDTGAMAGSLLVFSNDPDEETLAVSLMGYGVIPDIALSDTSHDYGDVFVGDSLNWLLTLYNEGTGILTIDSVLLAPTEYEILHSTFPDTISPSDSLEVNIRFAPINWGVVAGSLTIFSNDPDEETLSVALTGNGLAPDIAVSDSSLQFGDVLVGDSSARDLEVYNIGNVDLVIDSILFTHGDFIPVYLTPDTLGLADTTNVLVFFFPSDSGTAVGTLMAFTNDPDEETLFVALTGNGIAPNIAVSDTSHDFGDVLVGDSLEWNLNIFNIGTADLIIDSILAMPKEFRLSAFILPDTLPIGDSLALTITFLPTDTGGVNGNLIIYSSDPYKGTLSVTLTGQGVTPEITVLPDSLHVTIWEGGTISAPLILINEGTGILIFEMSDGAPWLSEQPDSGVINPEDSLTAEVIFDATTLTIGDYSDTIRVTSNDLDEPELTVPVHMTVREAQVIVSIPNEWSQPGDTVTMTLEMDNQTERDDPIAAFESHLTFVDTFLTVLNVIPTSRIDGLFDWSNPQPGRLIIVFATSELEAIAPDTGPIANITFQVSPAPMVGDSTPIHFEKLVLSDTLGYAIPMRTEDGTLFLGTGLKGDVNMDGEINILDAVWIINYILERIEFTPFQFWAADCNEDGEVNILDVVGIINVILGIGTCPPTPTAKATISSAIMWMEADGTEQNGDRLTSPIWIDSEKEIAGIQLSLRYNASKLIPGNPQLTERSSHMTLAFNAKDGELIIVLYGIEGEAIQGGIGPILTVPFETHNTGRKIQDAMMKFSEVILVGDCCQAIPVEIRPIRLRTGDLLPDTWYLSQNYPNPFNPYTDIGYQIPDARSQIQEAINTMPLQTTLRIFNILGQEVRTLVDEKKEPGYYTVTWDGRNENGKDVTSGVYFYRLSSGSFTTIKKMVLIR